MRISSPNRFLSPLFQGFLLAALFLSPVPPAVANDYDDVEVEALLEEPHVYWAQGVVFKDTLVMHPTGGDIKVGSKRYTRLALAKLGVCYADKSLVPRLQVQQLNRDYNFSATVLQQSGFIRKKYYYIIHDVQSAADVDNTIDRSLAILRRKGSVLKDGFGSDEMAELLEDAERELFAFRQENEVEGFPLAEPDSELHDRALQVIRAAVAQSEQKLGTTSREILTQFIKSVLVSSIAPPPEAAPTEEPSPAGTPPRMEPMPLDEGMDAAVPFGLENVEILEMSPPESVVGPSPEVIEDAIRIADEEADEPVRNIIEAVVEDVPLAEDLPLEEEAPPEMASPDEVVGRREVTEPVPQAEPPMIEREIPEPAPAEVEVEAQPGAPGIRPSFRLKVVVPYAPRAKDASPEAVPDIEEPIDYEVVEELLPTMDEFEVVEELPPTMDEFEVVEELPPIMDEIEVEEMPPPEPTYDDYNAPVGRR